ncbi:MAG: magnesium transporter [Robiginitomaculum sp.]
MVEHSNRGDETASSSASPSVSLARASVPTHVSGLELKNVDFLRNIICDIISGGDASALVDILEDVRPADIADYFEQLSTDEREAVANLAPQVFTSGVLAELVDDVTADVLPNLGAMQISEAVTELESDDAIQLIEELDETQRQEVMQALPERAREEVEAGFAFDEETAGRLMQREFVAAPQFWTVGQTIDHMRACGEDLPDLFFDIYIVNPQFHPLGYLPLSTLMRLPRKQVLNACMDAKLTVINPDMDQEDVAYLFEKYDLISAPVLDEGGRLSGMITVDDIVEIIHEENKEDMLALAGVSDAGVVDTAMSTVRSRAPWLLVNLITAIGASFVISLFQDNIAQFVALAVLMPIVASLGGNTGMQTLTVAIRALATRDLTSANAWRVIRREGSAALINGMIFAILLAGITFVWFRNWQLSAVIATALLFNFFCAGLAGILVPLSLKKVGADPAVASSVFVTTVTDVFGFFAFLGLASIFLL